MPKKPDYQTPLSAICLHASGFKTINLPVGPNKSMVEVRVPRLPLWDSDAGIFARCSAARTKQWCDENGAKMMSYNEANALNMSPETLKVQYIAVRETEEERKEREKEGGKNPLRNMGSMDWMKRFDAEFKKRVLEKGWDIDDMEKYNEMPVVSFACGKAWLNEVNYKMKGGAVNFGFWDVVAKKYVQNMGFQHGGGDASDGGASGHFDYSQWCGAIIL